MHAAITGHAMLTCLGDLDATYKALVAGQSGIGPLTIGTPAKLNVHHGYHLHHGDPHSWLTQTSRQALNAAGIDPAGRRVAAVVGTGLRQLRAVERWHGDGQPLTAGDLHFASAIRQAAPAISEVHTLANACAASGYALALALDLLALDEADAVLVAGVDTMTESMLTMIGRVGDESADMVRPFDADRKGVLLGEGAVAVVLERATGQPALGTLNAVGINCDAFHDTAPSQTQIATAMRQAHHQAGLTPDDIGLVLAHGTATALNDPTEAAALREVFGPQGPPVTGIKGAIGHTSGGAALMSLLIALTSMNNALLPPTVGLRTPIEQAGELDLIHGEPRTARPRFAQVNAFGFGGVNSVAIVEAQHG